MYQNLNSYSPKQIKRAYDVQGGRGTEAEDCFPFVYDYKCLWREGETQKDNKSEYFQNKLYGTYYSVHGLQTFALSCSKKETS